MLSEAVRSVVVMMVEQPVVALGAELTRVLDDAGELPVLGLSSAEVSAAIEGHLSVIDRLRAQLAVLIDRAAEIGLPAELGAPSMTAALQGRFGLSPGAATRLLRETAGLQGAPVAARAARLGAVGVEAAAEIGHAVTALPPELGQQLREEGEDVLLGYAVGREAPALDAGQIRYLGRHLHEIVDPEAADRLLTDRLAREDADVRRRRYLSIVEDPGGGVQLRGLLTSEAGAILRAVLGPLSAPRPVVRQTENGGGPGTVGGSAADDAAADHPVPNQRLCDQRPPEQAVPDERTGRQRSADALVEACERLLAHGSLPDTAGERPQLVITVDQEKLAADLGVGRLADGTHLPTATIRRLSCDAGLIPMVLGTAGQPLDLGRTARTASPAQRRALALRDGGCSFPGCDRPPGWCDAHHIREWQDLGPTDLDNLTLLCGRDHRTVHEDGWTIQPVEDGTRPLFIPPAWIDPQRRPRRNQLHHTHELFRVSR